MIYKLLFLESAQKEWDKLDHKIRDIFSKKLDERLKNPEIPKDKLVGMPYCYKIKLKSSGYRLVYRVIKTEIVVEVISVGARSKSQVYKKAHKRLGSHSL